VIHRPLVNKPGYISSPKYGDNIHYREQYDDFSLFLMPSHAHGSAPRHVLCQPMVKLIEFSFKKVS